jgi:hypothetical protein
MCWLKLSDDVWAPLVRKKNKRKGGKLLVHCLLGWAARSKHRAMRRAARACGCWAELARFGPVSPKYIFFLLLFFEFNRKLFTVLSINSVLWLQIEQNQLL